MNTNPRGYCLIISIRKGRSLGNDKDVGRLIRLFTSLKFVVELHEDLSEESIQELMKEEKEANHSPLCCFVMFILSHGCTDDEGYAYFQTYDNKHYKVSTIKKQIEIIPSLVGKPKLLFLQTCRGGILDTGREVLDCCDVETNHKISRGSDFLISFATIEDDVACRGADGSCFIQCLCDVFTSFHSEYDVLTMMTIITNRVAAIARRADGSDENVLQNPEFTSSFRKFLYFGKLPQSVYDLYSDS